MSARYIVGDVRDVLATIPDGSIDLVLTSPPFLALRSYLPADHPDKHREIGSEPDPATFLDTLLLLTAEWGRVLAPHGSSCVSRWVTPEARLRSCTSRHGRLSCGLAEPMANTPS